MAHWINVFRGQDQDKQLGNIAINGTERLGIG